MRSPQQQYAEIISDAIESMEQVKASVPEYIEALQQMILAAQLNLAAAKDDAKAYGPDYFDDPEFTGEPDFADPGGRSALRAATPDNPRNLPCPTCGCANRLTPADAARGYQCDTCADRAERGLDPVEC